MKVNAGPDLKRAKHLSEVNQTLKRFEISNHEVRRAFPFLTEQKSMRQRITGSLTRVKEMRRIKVDTKSKQAEKVEIKEQQKRRRRSDAAKNKRKLRPSALSVCVCV